MKTSFYFVIWILVYPFLRIFNNPFINNNSFIIAFIGVWILAYFINKSIPQIIIYDRRIKGIPMLEEIYTGNIRLFENRLNRDAIIQGITAVYFLLSTALIIIMMVIYHSMDWIALLIFIFLTLSVSQRAFVFVRSCKKLKSNPSSQTGIDIAKEIYNLSYISYYDRRQRMSYAAMFMPIPRHYGVFRIFSMCMALICMLLGIASVIMSIFSLIGNQYYHLGDFASSIIILYGALAVYYGISDFITSLQSVPK